MILYTKLVVPSWPVRLLATGRADILVVAVALVSQCSTRCCCCRCTRPVVSTSDDGYQIGRRDGEAREAMSRDGGLVWSAAIFPH